ncbi:hypothetical protein L228DRAFT_84231 [Xylona heveae TC161]|uniref:Uncharacterized protein n=1 Tax=Xylona heveae (strain CBS 132557 / TC161) TaxID=1328760 RepID=A0A165J6S9_XYLHT|nr:hypothetical protein L228DRAFT_84231 [Xylona heveae TC161]KZF25813.1 hypothetical protein L228DRAFT_84231 [Xylona heveae TC161]
MHSTFDVKDFFFSPMMIFSYVRFLFYSIFLRFFFNKNKNLPIQYFTRVWTFFLFLLNYPTPLLFLLSYLSFLFFFVVQFFSPGKFPNYGLGLSHVK